MYTVLLGENGSLKSNQIKSNVFCGTKMQIPVKERKIKSKLPTGHKGSKELH